MYEPTEGGGVATTGTGAVATGAAAGLGTEDDEADDEDAAAGLGVQPPRNPGRLLFVLLGCTMLGLSRTRKKKDPTTCDGRDNERDT